MSTQDTVHTTTDANGIGWVNQAKGVVLSRHKVKANAVSRGRALARRHSTDLTVHRKDLVPPISGRTTEVSRAQRAKGRGR